MSYGNPCRRSTTSPSLGPASKYATSSASVRTDRGGSSRGKAPLTTAPGFSLLIVPSPHLSTDSLAMPGHDKKSSTVGCASPGYVSMVRSRRSHSGLSQRAATGTLNVKNRQSLGPMRRSHLQPCPRRNDRRRERELERSARPGDRLPAPRGRTRGHTSPRSPAGAAAARASRLAISGSRPHWFDSRRTDRFEYLPGQAG